MKKWNDFVSELPDERTTELTIIDIGNVRQVGNTECIPVLAMDSGGEERELLIPTNADLDIDEKTGQLTGGRLSQSGKSYSQPGYDWNIDGGVGTLTPLKELLEQAAEAATAKSGKIKA